MFTGREYLGTIQLYDYRNRTYSPKWGRFIEVDPIRFEGRDLNLYRYVRNWVMELIDPLGLYTEVIFWAPGEGASSFGHISIVVNNVSFSWGKFSSGSSQADLMTVSSADTYISARSKIGPGEGIVLNLTPDQELALEEYFGNMAIDGPPYSLLFNNCMQVVRRGLASVGVDIGGILTPESMYNYLLTNYPNNQRVSHPFQTETSPSTNNIHVMPPR